MLLDKLGLKDIIDLHNQKHQHIKESNLIELIKLKNSYPELFDNEKEIEFYELLNTIKKLKETPHFKAMLYKENKKKFITLDYHAWRKGDLEELISQYTIIHSNDMYTVSRAMVKEAIIGCWDILCLKERKPVAICDVFPFLGFLFHKLIVKFPPEKQQKMIERVLYKLHDQKQESVINKEKNTISRLDTFRFDQQIKDYFHNIVEMVSQKIDKRKDYYSDAVFFCLMETAEFIGLLIPKIGVRELKDKNKVINSIYKRFVLISI